MLRNLPAVPPGFVGRRGELAHLDDALREERVVTLTGAGGVGKSRLALEAADRVLHAGERGVAWADLWPLRDDRLLVATVADAVDFADHTTDQALDSLAAWLADRDALLVLDSCEHLVGPCRRLVARLTSACPRLTVLATSREPLGVPGEHVVAVEPLPPATDAVEMFRLRAAAAGTPLSSPADMVTAARLCERLEGMPLAVELIAGQLAHRTVGEVELELGRRLDITADGPLPGPPRHRAVRTTIGWSHELCAPVERLLWARMSVFREPVDATTVRLVCGGGPLPESDVDRALTGLVRKSVLSRAGSGYRMLDTVREYGRMWLDQVGESRESADRHASHFLAMARDAQAGWLGEQQARWYERLGSAHADLCAALDHLLSARPDAALELTGLLAFPWSCCGHLREAAVYGGRAGPVRRVRPGQGEGPVGAGRHPCPARRTRTGGAARGVLPGPRGSPGGRRGNPVRRLSPGADPPASGAAHGGQTRDRGRVAGSRRDGVHLRGARSVPPGPGVRAHRGGAAGRGTPGGGGTAARLCRPR
ncbi:ATP-binding protein [Streptomyces sp. NPDC059371]|uniref:ATP-binding protein n=1 Tax=Streptomyces sp. NPDC059371 TaxID=3346812 RepID=UPI0036C26DF9